MNRHAKVIQQRKIARLEMRLAQLEKEAGLWDMTKALGRGLFNIPASFIQNIINVFKLAWEELQVDFKSIRKDQQDAAFKILEIRIARSFTGGLGFTTFDTPELVTPDYRNPLKSLWSWGKTKEVTLVQLLDDRNVGFNNKEIKATFARWWGDFKYTFGEPMSHSVIKKDLSQLSRKSKLLWHLFTAVLNTQVLIANTTIFSLIMLVCLSLHPLLLIGLNNNEKYLLNQFVGLNVLNLITTTLEKAFRLVFRGSDAKVFDELASKKASYTPYPYTTYAVQQLKAYA